jgi:hypothetical protein
MTALRLFEQLDRGGWVYGRTKATSDTTSVTTSDMVSDITSHTVSDMVSHPTSDTTTKQG